LRNNLFGGAARGELINRKRENDAAHGIFAPFEALLGLNPCLCVADCLPAGLERRPVFMSKHTVEKQLATSGASGIRGKLGLNTLLRNESVFGVLLARREKAAASAG
jgi:hypothetical protein